jgi:cytoskeletal protein CcmA (bactofilin family)
MTRKAIGRILVVLMVLLSALAGATGVAAAQSSQSGGSVVVAEGETVDDLDAFGGAVVVRGTVDGDLEAFGGTVSIEEGGEVTGNLTGAAGSVSIRGTVGGSAEVSAGAVTVGQEATIGGDLAVAAGDLVIAGTVDGDVEAAVETLRLASSASVGGDVTHAPETSVDRAEGATVGGTVSASENLTGGGEQVDFGPLGLLFSIYGVVVTLILGVVLLGAFPRFSRDVATTVREEPLRSGGIGLAAAVGIPVGLLALAITIVGIPFTFMGFMAFGLLAFVSAVLAEYAVGSWVLSAAGVDNRWAALFVGVVVVALLAQLPYVGWLINLVVFLLGFGAVVVLLVRGYRRRDDESAGTEGAATPAV